MSSRRPAYRSTSTSISQAPSLARPSSSGSFNIDNMGDDSSTYDESESFYPESRSDEDFSEPSTPQPVQQIPSYPEPSHPLSWLTGDADAIPQEFKDSAALRHNIFIKHGLPVSSPAWPEIKCHCPRCKRNGVQEQTMVVKYNTGSWKCLHCGWWGDVDKGPCDSRSRGVGPHWTLPEWNPLPLPERVTAWFSRLNISESTLRTLEVGYAPTWDIKNKTMTHAIAIPYKREGVVVNVKYVFSDGHESFEPGCEPVFYGVDDISSDCTFIVDGEFDRMALMETGYHNVISVPTVCGSFEKDYEASFTFLLSVEKSFSTVKKFVLAMPASETGRRLEDEISRRIGKERSWRVQWPEGADRPVSTLGHFGFDGLLGSMEEARPFPVKGIFEAHDVYDRIDSLYDFGLPRGVRAGWPTFDECYSVKEGQWTLVTGIPGHGKSNFLDAMLVNLAVTQNWRFGMFSPENQPIERHFANLMEKYVDAPFSFGATERMTVEQREHAKRWVHDHFSVILPDEDEGNWTIDGILNLAKILVFRKGIKGLVIDPWNELDHSRSNGMSETEHISQALTKIRQFSRTYSVHVWVVAHPAKLHKDQTSGRYPVPTPYDVSGSAHWANKADNAIAVWRNRGGIDEDISDIHIQKIRFKEVGQVGIVSLRYDRVTGRFHDDIDQDLRQRALAEGRDVPSREIRRKGYLS